MSCCFQYISTHSLLVSIPPRLELSAQSTDLQTWNQVLKVNQEKWKRAYQKLCANGFTTEFLEPELGVFVSLNKWLTEWVAKEIKDIR